MTKRQTRQAGFSLIELLVTAMIFAIGLLGLAALQVSTIRSNAGGRNRVTATSLAEGCMSAIQAEGNLSWSYAAGVQGLTTVFAGARTFTGGAANGTFGTFDVDGLPVAAGAPTQVFQVQWTRLAPTSATPKALITGMTMNEFVVTVAWTDQAAGANGVALAPSTMTLSRLIRY